MTSIPPILDVRDDLYRALEESESEEAVAEEIEAALDRLDAFADRDLADREGEIDEIDNQLLRVEELLDDEAAARALQSARNRIHIYRATREETDENLVVVDSGVREVGESEADESGTDAVLPVGEVAMTVTVANTGDDASDVIPIVSFYDQNGDELESVRGPAFDVGSGDERRLELTVDAPGDASWYAVSVTDDAVRDRAV